MEKRTSRFQAVMTAVISNRERLDGREVLVQEPKRQEEELAYWKATVQESYAHMEAAQQRLLELVYHLKHRREDKKRTAWARDMVQQLEQAGQFPQAHDAFDHSVLTVPLTRFLESEGKQWVSELECSRHIQWRGQWRRVDAVGAELRQEHPQSFRPVFVRCRNGEAKHLWALTKVVRLKRYGRKRLVIVHEREELTDVPRFLVTDALHWESGRVMETGSYRWASEIFHELGKQRTGLESAQVRKEEAVQRHFRLSGVAQSLLQRASAPASASERFAFAQGNITIGQRCRAIAREVLRSLLELAKRLFAEGKPCEQVLEMLMPA